MRCIYSKGGAGALTTSAGTAVCHHVSAPRFYEEIKV